MATSQNGWPAANVTTSFVRGSACGLGFWAANSDVRWLFEDLINWFNEEIEPISGSVLDDWSWANRNVRGSDTTVSNHASASAIDLNALKHPRGAKGTYTSAQRAKLKARMANRYKNLIRSGEFYVIATIDGMHFEINGTKAQIAQLVKDLKAEDEEMNLTKENLEDIAKAVLNLDAIPNKNAPAGSKNPNWTLKSMISDIENTQDQHTETLKEIKALLAQLTKG